MSSLNLKVHMELKPTSISMGDEFKQTMQNLARKVEDGWQEKMLKAAKLDHQVVLQNWQEAMHYWCLEHIGARYDTWTYKGSGIWKFDTQDHATWFVLIWAGSSDEISE